MSTETTKEKETPITEETQKEPSKETPQTTTEGGEANAGTEGASEEAATASAEGEAEEDSELAVLRQQVSQWEKEETAGDDKKEGEKGSQTSSDADLRSVYVGNVDYSVTEAELIELFSSCGAVARATILKDKYTGGPKVSSHQFHPYIMTLPLFIGHNSCCLPLFTLILLLYFLSLLS